MNDFVHSFNRRVSKSFLNQSICAKAIFLVLLIYFFVVKIIHPLVCYIFYSELVRRNIFVKLGITTRELDLNRRFTALNF